jgi:hypothetical protein
MNDTQGGDEHRSSPSDDTNLLARIRGDDVADVLNSLGPCTKASPDQIELVREIDGVSMRFTCRKFHDRRWHRLFWTCDRAVRE